MKSRKTAALAMSALVLFAPAELLAQEEGGVPDTGQAVNEESGVRYQRKTVINFEDDTIEGDLKTPDGQYLEVRARSRHRSLIRIRTQFRREVLGSISDL